LAARDAGRTQLYRFGPFELEARAGELRKIPQAHPASGQPLRARPAVVVLRGEIQQALWPNQTVVEFDQGINAAIKRLLSASGDSAAGARYIETDEDKSGGRPVSVLAG